ncbi:MAG: hypothetical protein DI539_20830 [Flavobacterium psychrophilum]|nr:MAG: hypothetical protein DI539_20830 [Flavobacterium psychrophilum]
MKPETKYRGSIKLSAIGDALGWITEFEKTPNSLREKYETERIERFYSWKKNVGGRFLGFVDTIAEGSYSDDTQLLLSVARSIKSDGRVDNEYFAKSELVNWLDYARGGGRTVKTAANKVARKSVTWYSNFYNFKVNGELQDYKDSGANGAAMRVLPIALANLGNIEKIKEEIFCNSIVTHGHPRAILGAMLYGYALNQIIVYRPEDFQWENYLTQIGSELPNKLSLSFVNRTEIQEWLKLWNKSKVNSFEKVYEETLIEIQSYLRTIYQSIRHGQSTIETLRKIGCLDSSTKGSGTATVVAGIFFAAKFHEAPAKGIIESVNALGTDTDSIASFTGGLLGALHGSSVVPDRWRHVQDADYLEQIANRLLEISEDRATKNPMISNLGLKKLNDPKLDDFSLDEPIEFTPLGKGKIISIKREPTLTRGKYNLIMEVHLDIGQSIFFSKLFSDKEQHSLAKAPNNNIDLKELLDHAVKVLSPESFKILTQFLEQQKKLPNGLLNVFKVILNNER